MEGFNMITDPETDMPIDTKTAHGKQIIKNYLNAIKFGPDSDKIVSTKMFYKQKGSSSKSKNLSLIKDSNVEKEKKMNLIKEEKTEKTEKINTTSESNNVGGGSIRGTCPICNKSVFSSQERVKSGGKYYHEKCYNCQ